MVRSIMTKIFEEAISKFKAKEKIPVEKFALELARAGSMKKTTAEKWIENYIDLGYLKREGKEPAQTVTILYEIE